jgi:hypothetical protein
MNRPHPSLHLAPVFFTKTKVDHGALFARL